MRRVLVLGGTGWLGREVAGRFVAEGADVVCLARGESGQVAGGARLVPADRRSPNAYDEVLGDWDEVVEVAYAPDLVEPALDALADSAAHWTLISTVSVYTDHDEKDADETAPVVEPTDLSQYPDAKVAAERATAARLGARLLTVRPGLIVGPGDPSDRFGYWLARLSRPGPVLVPVSAGRFVQVIDVADLADWIERSSRHGHVGVVDAVGEVHAMADFFRTAVLAAGYEGELVEVEDDLLHAHDINYWAGPRSLPLWAPIEYVGHAHRSGAKLRASGGTLRSLQDTLRRVLIDERARGINRERRAGLTPHEEADVLYAVR